MKRTAPLIASCMLVLCLNACDTYSKHVVGMTPEEMEKNRSSKDELWEENKRLKAKNEKVLAADRKVLANSKGLAQENRTLKEEQVLLQEKVGALEDQLADARAEVKSGQDARADRKALKIKVLASDGDVNTAWATARKLVDMGYHVERTDRVRKKYDGTKVYFARGFETQGNELASELGGETIVVQPLTWPSIFDIIIVTDTVR